MVEEGSQFRVTAVRREPGGGHGVVDAVERGGFVGGGTAGAEVVGGGGVGGRAVDVHVFCCCCATGCAGFCSWCCCLDMVGGEDGCYGEQQLGELKDEREEAPEGKEVEYQIWKGAEKNTSEEGGRRSPMWPGIFVGCGIDSVFEVDVCC